MVYADLFQRFQIGSKVVRTQPEPQMERFLRKGLPVVKSRGTVQLVDGNNHASIRRNIQAGRPNKVGILSPYSGTGFVGNTDGTQQCYAYLKGIIMAISMRKIEL